MELESQVQEAEVLNQTLTSAYQELKAEIDRLEGEKSQERFHEVLAAQNMPASSFDPFPTASSSSMAGYGQGGTTWGNSDWTPQEWETEDSYDNQG